MAIDLPPPGTAGPAEPDAPDDERYEIVVAVLLALVALTAALAAWRTTTVGSNAAEATRQGLIDTVKLQDYIATDESLAYQEAGWAVRALTTQAESAAMQASDVPALRQLGRNVEQYSVPNLSGPAGAFLTDDLFTPEGPPDVAARMAQLRESEPLYGELGDPQEWFAQATTYSDEKQWLTVVSVVLAIALFWLGLAEIGRGRWRLVNMLVGVAIWAIGIGALVTVELYAVGTRGGAL